MLKCKKSTSVGVRLLCLLLVLLLSGLLSGCNLLQTLFNPAFYNPRRTVAFSEMTYTRPDFTRYRKDIQETTKQIQENKGSYRKQLGGLQSFYKSYQNYYTMYSLAYLKYAINTNDPFYYDEYMFFGETEPELEQAMENLFVACYKSKHKKKFEKDFFGKDFLDQYKGGGTYSDALVDLMKQEAQLVQSYSAQTANPTVEYMGQTASLYDLLTGAATQKEYDAIMRAYAKQANMTLGGIYAELVLVRLQIAASLGYDNYAEYAYEKLERDYTAKMGADFVDQVEKSLVPLYRTLANNGIVQHPTLDTLSWREIPGIVQSAVSKIDDSVKDAFSFMEKYELYDLAPSVGKLPYDFTTYIQNYDAPFMMINAQEKSSDLFTFSHEFGHFTDMYLNYNGNYILDLSECASQGMEYLMLAYLPDGQSKLRDNLTAYKMYDTMNVYITQSAYTAFEQQVYSLSPEEVTLQKINQIAQDITARFFIQAEDKSFATSWIMIPHFYEQAFYCISYCVSNDIALQIYEAECASKGAGAKIYMDFIRWDTEQTFLENVERVKLKNPCEKERVQEIAAFLAAYYKTDVPMAA